MPDDPMVTWLRSALDHVEAVTVAASRDDKQQWHVALPGTGWAVDGVVRDADWPSEEQAAHIALHDPRAVLARVEAEKRLVAVLVEEMAWTGDQPLRWLAYGHRFDIEGYDERWVPEGMGVSA